MKQSLKRCFACENLVKGNEAKLCPSCTFLEEEGLLKGILRFSAKSLRVQRKQLGLSAEDYGTLVGVSGSTVRNWELGKSRPENPTRFALSGILMMDKQGALELLKVIKSDQ